MNKTPKEYIRKIMKMYETNKKTNENVRKQ